MEFGSRLSGKLTETEILFNTLNNYLFVSKFSAIFITIFLCIKQLLILIIYKANLHDSELIKKSIRKRKSMYSCNHKTLIECVRANQSHGSHIDFISCFCFIIFFSILINYLHNNFLMEYESSYIL